MSRMTRAAVRMAAVAALLLPATPGSAAPVPHCAAAAFSPAFARDRTMFCLTQTGAGTHLLRSADGGRTWPARVLVADRYVHGPDVIVSPAFPDDRTLFVVSTLDSMWVSRDGGRTFGLEMAGPAWGSTRTAAYVETVPVPHASLVEAPGAMIGSAVYDSIFGVRDVAGTIESAVHYVVPPDYARTREAVGISWESDIVVAWQPVQWQQMKAYLCRGDFVCTTETFDFGRVNPVATLRIADGDDVVITSPDEPDPDVPRHRQLRVWRSVDYGRTWQRWLGVERLMHRNGGFPTVHITKSPDAPRRLFAQLDVRTRDWAGPRLTVWRSDDDGATWRRVGYAWTAKQPKAGQGTLPWNGPGESIAQTGTWTTAQPGNRLYAIGAREIGEQVGEPRLWCSRDFGRTWRAYC